MTTQTATATTEADATINAAERAQKVYAAIVDGNDSHKLLIMRTGIAKTTLLATLTFLTEAGRVEKVQDGRNVFYRAINPKGDRRVQASPDGVLPYEPTAADRLATPHPAVAAAIAAKAGTAAPAQRSETAPQAAPAAPAAAAGTRLTKGQQEALILRFLAEHPADSFGPYELGRAIAPAGHKPLGVRDACARMASRGQIITAQEKPVRYAHRANTAPQGQ